ncbi:MAG TPA: GIY-YIG nuclease family protein, partial [Allosphingosinicella sp.]
MDFYTYLLRCSDGSYYTGHTDDLDARVAQHQSGQVTGYTQKRRPVQLIWAERFPDCDSAFAAERQIKGWTPAKKEALARGDLEALRQLAKKSFDAPVRLRSPATQDEREGRSDSDSSLILSSGLSEAEGPISKDPAERTPAIVLVRPQLGENIGKAARAMLNFGLTDLRLVNPRDGWPNPAAGPAA